MIKLMIAPLAVGLSLSASAMASAQDAARQCETRGQNGMVTLLLCPKGLDSETLKNEGIAACADRKPCGAWIWDDEAKVPATAPDSHDKLTREQITSAVGVWINETAQLMLFQKTN